MPGYRKQEGVTLVGLLVTIIILGILATVTIKRINKKDSFLDVAKNTAKTVESKNSNTQLKINHLKEQE